MNGWNNLREILSGCGFEYRNCYLFLTSLQRAITSTDPRTPSFLKAYTDEHPQSSPVKMPASEISFSLKALASCCMFSINVMTMHTFLDAGPSSTEPAIDSNDPLMEFFESLEPLESGFIHGVPPSLYDVDQHQAKQNRNLLNLEDNDAYPPVKRLRLDEAIDSQHKKALDRGNVSEITGPSASIPAIDRRNLFFDESIDDRLPLWLRDDVEERFTVMHAKSGDWPGGDTAVGPSELLPAKEPRGSRSYSCNNQDFSPTESGHGAHTSLDTRREDAIESLDLLNGDISINPMVARQAPPEHFSPYLEKLKNQMNQSYGGISGLKRQLVAQCDHLPIRTYKYKGSNSHREPMIVNSILDQRKEDIVKKEVMRSLGVLIKWIFYSHSQLLEHRGVDLQDQSVAHGAAFSWLFYQLFQSECGAPIFKRVFARDDRRNFNFSKVQRFIIRFISERDARKKAPYLSVYILECWYTTTMPGALNEVLEKGEIFSKLMMKLFFKEELLQKKRKASTQRREKWGPNTKFSM